MFRSNSIKYFYPFQCLFNNVNISIVSLWRQYHFIQESIQLHFAKFCNNNKNSFYCSHWTFACVLSSKLLYYLLFDRKKLNLLLTNVHSQRTLYKPLPKRWTKVENAFLPFKIIIETEMDVPPTVFIGDLSMRYWETFQKNKLEFSMKNKIVYYEMRFESIWNKAQNLYQSFVRLGMFVD